MAIGVHDAHLQEWKLRGCKLGNICFLHELRCHQADQVGSLLPFLLRENIKHIKTIPGQSTCVSPNPCLQKLVLHGGNSVLKNILLGALGEKSQVAALTQFHHHVQHDLARQSFLQLFVEAFQPL